MEIMTDTDGYLLIERKNGEYITSVKGLGKFDVVEALGHGAVSIAHRGNYKIPNVLQAIADVAEYDEEEKSK